MAVAREAKASFISSCSPENAQVTPSGMGVSSRTRVISLITSACSRPKESAPTMTADWRSTRLISVGPLASSMCAIWRKGMKPREVGTCRSRIWSSRVRSDSCNWTRMSASAPSPRKVATSSPSTRVRMVLPTVAMLMPRSAALRRSTTSSTSGLPG